MAVIVIAPIELIYKSILLILLALLSIVRFRGYGFNQRARVIEAQIKSSGRSKLLLADGRRVTASLRKDCVLTPWLILLRFDVRNRWGHTVMVLFQDALPEEEMRQLRILLKHGSYRQNGE
jgi:hypothetical protein